MHRLQVASHRIIQAVVLYNKSIPHHKHKHRQKKSDLAFPLALATPPFGGGGGGSAAAPGHTTRKAHQHKRRGLFATCSTHRMASKALPPITRTPPKHEHMMHEPWFCLVCSRLLLIVCWSLATGHQDSRETRGLDHTQGHKDTASNAGIELIFISQKWRACRTTN